MACGVVIAILLAGAAATMWLRKKLWEVPKSSETGPTGFTLGDLRQLLKSGKISNEEFERARAAVVAAAQRAAARDAAKHAPPAGRDRGQ